MKRLYILTGLLLVTMLMVAPAAYADVYQTYNLTWSTPVSDAHATGQITLDLTKMPNPTAQMDDPEITSAIQSLTVTVVGPGGGTWTKADLGEALWSTGGLPLDMGRNLIGQPTLGGTWGTTDGYCGDFNLFFNNNGPYGLIHFVLLTNAGSLQLTEFSPTSVTPEPGTMLLLGTGLAGLAKMARRKLGQRA